MPKTVTPTDPHDIGRAQVDCLADLLEHPIQHTQRCVEQLEFLPSGGQHWTRSVQIQLPLAGPSSGSWQVVSLGMFRRRRFPDFTVRDACGTRLSLVTRRQHGTVLTWAVLRKYFVLVADEIGELNEGKKRSARRHYDELTSALFVLMTSATIKSRAERRSTAEKIGRSYIALVDALGFPSDDFIKPRDALVDELVELQGVTQYLCWVKVAPGAVINLEATYTVEDARRPLFPRLSIEDQELDATASGMSEGRMERYRELGLAPLNYGFRIPSHDHVGSYYFMMRPPLNSSITFIDWESGNSIDDHVGELDSAFHSVHLHNDLKAFGAKYGGVISAFVRNHPREHKKIAAGAFLNALFVFLVAAGRFSGDFTGAAVWLLLTPTALIAFLAEQQRHYYSYATRLQRGVLWWYLLLSVGFLIVLSFSFAKGGRAGVEWGWVAWGVAGALVAASAVVFALYAPLGYSFEKFTNRWYQGKRGKSVAILRYESVVRKYCDLMIGGVAAAVICVSVLAAVMWPARWQHVVEATHIVHRAMTQHHAQKRHDGQSGSRREGRLHADTRIAAQP